MYSEPTSVMFAALTMASAASTEPMKPRVSTMPSASRVASISLTGMILCLFSNMQRTVSRRGLRHRLGVAPWVWAPLAALAFTIACSKPQGNSPAVATADVALSRSRVAQGSPVDLTYKFQVSADMASHPNQRVFVHVVDADEELMWTDDHDPPKPSTT